MSERPFSEAYLRELRLRYNAAFSAYQYCVIALAETALSGRAASPELLRCEAQALRDLIEARSHVLDALAATAYERS
jgi:hypothetical protein